VPLPGRKLCAPHVELLVIAGPRGKFLHLAAARYTTLSGAPWGTAVRRTGSLPRYAGRAMPRGTRTFLVRLLVLVGSGLVLAATFVPTNGGGIAGYPYSIYDPAVQREFELFAAEPVAVALLAVAAALLLLGSAPALTAGLLLAFGAQTFILFMAYVVIATFGNPNYNSFRPGGLLGLLGALLLITAGVIALRTPRTAKSPAARTSEGPGLPSSAR
jgi:hypothetical protein